VKDDVDIATPAVQLSWKALDALREAKKTTPFSGTTIIEVGGRAVWFSKNILPAIRKEAALRETQPLSPVLRHIGLYGFRRAALERFTQLPQSHYEGLEGLEQLRALENGMSTAIVKVGPPRISSPGIDTKDDLKRAEALIAAYGDPFTA
jgi:3-deoxy-manno-octulosonate cytidylyltransferase (CMP-KDO synthetase)